MPKLVVEQGKDTGAEALVTDQLTVGRGTECGIVLHDRQSSRQHCRFEVKGETLVVKDLGSRNGILVNGVKALEAELKPGDRITIGGTVIRVGEGALGAWSGKTVSGYRFLDKIGEGGMGEVYRAEQISMRRHVAAKVLSKRLHEDPKYIDRLLKEARAAAQFNHPGLIQVHDVVQAPEITFFSMELVQGRTLREHLRAGPIGVPQLLSVARQAADALKYAHAKGIVHHDVKPENIMLGEDGRVKLADLGIAQPAGADIQTGASGKRTLLGTPQYMAPDQVTGDKIDPRFDLYSLGATCYHALSGRAPYRGGTPEEIVKQLIATPPPPLASLAPNIPPDLIAFVERLMARDPAARTPTADQALKELAALQARYGEEAGTAHTGTGSGPVVHEHRPRRARPSRKVGAALLGLVALGGVVMATYAMAKKSPPVTPTPPPPKPPVKPVEPKIDAAHAERLAKALKAQTDGDLDGALILLKACLDASPPDDIRAKADAALTTVESARRDRNAAAAWAALDAALPGMDEGNRLAALSRFVSEYRGTPSVDLALTRLTRLQGEMQAREAQRLAALAAEADALAQEAQRMTRGTAKPMFFGAVAKLSTFLKAHPDLPVRTRQNLEGLQADLQGEREAFCRQRRAEYESLLPKGQFKEALRVVTALAELEAPWRETVQTDLARIQRFVDDHLQQGLQAAAKLKEDYDLTGAEQAVLRLVDTLDGMPQQATALLHASRLKVLKTAHQAVVLKAATATTAKAQFKITIRNSRGESIGEGRVEGATTESLSIRFRDGAKTAVDWKKLSPQECLDIYRFYLDQRETTTLLGLFVLCWDRGLWAEADKILEGARPGLAAYPGLEEDYLRSRPRP